MANRKAVDSDNITVGHVYKSKENENSATAEVIPYFVDFARGTVKFAPVGRSSEDELSTVDFLKTYEYFGPLSSRAEKQVEKK